MVPRHRVEVEVPHCSLSLGQAEVWILGDRKLDVAIALREPLDYGVGEVIIGDKFVDRGEPAADVCSLHDVIVGIFARLHRCR